MKNSIQMVDEDQVENVGIMSGFMDDLEGLLEELSAEEMEGMKEGDEADMARTMERSPDSPEILMNNLRGDMRSIDARREELSDLVGFREAEETPEGVLALLQPILGQQAEPMMPPQGMPAMMPPQGMPPQGMPPMPPQGMPPMMPPQGMPPQQLAAGGPVGYADGGSTLSQEQADAQAEAQAMAGLLGREAQAAAEARAAQTPEYQQAQAIADAQARADAQAQAARGESMPPQGTPVYDPNTGALIGMSYANDNLPAGFPTPPPMGDGKSMPISPDDAAIRDLLLQQGQQVAPPVAGPATRGIGSLAPPVDPVGEINDGSIMQRMQEEQQRRMMEEQQRRMMEEQQRRMMEEQQRRMMEEQQRRIMEERPRTGGIGTPMPPYDPRTGGIGTPIDGLPQLPPTDIGYDPRPRRRSDMPPMMPPMDDRMPPMMPVGTPVDQRPMFMPQGMQQGMPPPDSGVGALFAPTNAPMFMADGGMVQHFQDGSDAAGVTPSGTYSPEIIAEALRRMGGSSVPTIQEGVERNLPMYQELLGSDPSNTQAQMLFDIGQAALGYAGNVGPDGQPLRGSAAARLAGATRELPGRIGARAAAMDQEKQGIRLAALQASQAERAAALQAQGERFVTLTPEEIEAEGLDPVYTWQRSPLTGELKTLGSRPRVPDNVTVTSGETYAESVAKLSATGDGELVQNAGAATNNIAKLDEALRVIDSGDVNLGIGSEIATNFDRVKAQFLGDSEAQRRASTDQYLDALLGSDVFTAISSLGIGARGLDTPAEREFLRQVLTGTRALDQSALRRITELRRQREVNIIKEYNNRVELGELDAFFDASNKVKRTFEIPSLPSFSPKPRGEETAEEALARRRREALEGAG